MKIVVHTFGCKLNQSESEALASAFRNQGFLIVPADYSADVVIINTCTVTSKSEQKARRIIRKYLVEKPEALIVVTGCYAQLRSAEIRKISDKLIVLPHDRKDLLLDLPEAISGNSDIRVIREKLLQLRTKPLSPERKRDVSSFKFKVTDYSFHTRPFLKIQDGCNNTCSYCTVPLARGTSVSRHKESILSEVKQLEERGYREIVLTGVNISSYNSQGEDLPELITSILGATRKVRIRLSSLEPDGITGKLCRSIDSPRICAHFHLPVQSGSPSVLKKMNRRYTPERVKEAVAMLRGVKEDPFISADVIVGFPGESDVDFEETRSLIESNGFTKLHVFQFSSRPGTAAEKMNGKIPERRVKERSQILMTLSEQLFHHYLRRWDGKQVEVCIEGPTTDEKISELYGLTDNYLRVMLKADMVKGVKTGSLCEGELMVNGDNCCRLKSLTLLP